MKSPAYAPLDGLVDLACRDGVDVRPTLLRVLTDLYVQKPTHSADEVTQYVELALGLIDTVDETTRAAVAASLSGYAAAPAAVMARLGLTAPASATVFVGLPEVDYAADAPEAVDTIPDSLVDVFFSSGAEDRRLILLYLDAAAPASARLSPAASGDVIKQIEHAALQRNTKGFARALARALGIPRGLAERVAGDASGEPIVVAAKALGMKAAVLQRILLFVNPAVGQSVQRVYDLADLFDEMTREAAERMLTIWRDSGVVAAPVHQPVYGEDGSRDGRTAHRDVGDGVDTPARVKSAG
ncbi:MAG: DUF2336 domain-containing protein [Pseudolabrys sp.]|nr:DUF2336 domain-containing protein [Pseudolabrys sp.]MDP2298084.1 DUF2336 domain-containing protein [Pseudolabrys sp.]